VEGKLEISVKCFEKMYILYDGLKYMLGNQILIRLDPDLFVQIQILEIAMAVRGLIFQPSSQIGIRIIANSMDLRTMILHLQMRYTLRTIALKLPIFKREKDFVNRSLGFIYDSLALSQPQSRDTVSLRRRKDGLVN
jgi:hypothetical protein